MNDDLQKALAEILNKTTQGVEAGVGFLQRELPEVVQQILIWHGVKSAIFFSIGLGMLIGALWGAKKFWRAGCAAHEENEYADQEGYVVGFCACAVASTVGATVLLANITWLQILLAPKLYLIEYAASLVK